MFFFANVLQKDGKKGKHGREAEHVISESRRIVFLSQATTLPSIWVNVKQRCKRHGTRAGFSCEKLET